MRRPPPKAACYSGSTKSEKLQFLQRHVNICEKCPNLASTRTQPVFGAGNIEAELMFVGEAPGRDEDALGKPFIGNAGRFLNVLLRMLKLERADVYIANALKCRPDTAPDAPNRPPTRPELLDCAPYLYAQIEIIQPVAIVAFGSSSLEPFMIDETITEARGQKFQFMGAVVVPTFHPAYVLRNPEVEVRQKVWSDVLLAYELCGGTVTEDLRAWLPPIP